MSCFLEPSTLLQICTSQKYAKLKVALQQWIESPNEIVRLMATKMLVKYDKYWSTCHVFMGIACVLDPRYKMKLVEFYFSSLYRNKASVEIDRIRRSCYEMVNEYNLNLRSNGSNLDVPAIDSTLPDSDELDPLLSYDLFVSSSSTKVNIRSELDFYLEETVLPRTPNFDVLS